MNFEPLFRYDINPSIAAMANYIAEIAPGSSLPKRADFRPNRVRELLGFYFLIDIIENDYRYSLAGEHMSILFGLDITGRCVSEFPNGASLEMTYNGVVAYRTFQYTCGRYVWADRSLDIERLLIPMLGPDGTLNTILGVTIPLYPTEQLSVFAGIGPAGLEIDEMITGEPIPA